jgi:ATP-binding cassette subfamily B protein RaxB
VSTASCVARAFVFDVASSAQFVEGIIDGILVLGTLAMTFLYSPKVAAIAGVAVFLYTLLRLAIFGKRRDATAEQIIHAAKQQTHFMESVRGIQSIRLFGRSEERRASWTNALVVQLHFSS